MTAPLQIECIPTETVWLPRIVPGRPQRGWMDKFADRHAYRCLPLTMANTTGWEILSPGGITATWNGGIRQEDITITADPGFGGLDNFAQSHFSHGVLTFHTGWIFRTPPGWSMWVTGSPNHVKDGIQSLSGLVETDWLPFPFTMNWIFTRPGTIRFEKGEPFCFITLMQDKPLEEFELVQRSLDDDPEFDEQYRAWFKARDEFNKKIYARDPRATKEAWQRFYFKGEMAADGAEPPKEHVNKRRLKSLKVER
jgi:hypothetical protein